MSAFLLLAAGLGCPCLVFYGIGNGVGWVGLKSAINASYAVLAKAQKV